MKFFTDSQYDTELHDVVKLYFPDAELSHDAQQSDILCNTEFSGSRFVVCSHFGDVKTQQVVDLSAVTDKLHAVRLCKRYAKLCLYSCLSQKMGVQMPWGSLTGIRPTKLAYQLISEGADFAQTFVDVLGVSPTKTQLVLDILESQKGLRNFQPNTADLYIGIPFCVTRCSYCSFSSGEISKMQQYVKPYVDALVYDIKQTLHFAKDKGITIKNVYIGGGTPTSLDVMQLNEVLSAINSEITPEEFTVEAGRPDTVDKDKLQLFLDSGVDRVSINPQTFNQSVLDEIGRKHTIEDIFVKTNLAKDMGFVVNMDLIAGLPTENNAMFAHSINSAISLTPDNITVHTLALKRGSLLKEQNFSQRQQDVSDMVEYSHKMLYANGYKPYYMYRQKYMTQNLENVGFCKIGKPCLYNIDIMEETRDILACGANAISKRVISTENRIERAANAKDVLTYIQRTEGYIARKRALYDNN